MAGVSRLHRNNLISEYFKEGFSNGEILQLLILEHNTVISRRQLRRILNCQGHYRRGRVELERALAAIEIEVEGSGRCLGYRAMQQRLLSRYGMTVPRDLVATIQRVMDPEGVEMRRRHRLSRRTYRSKGPNYVIHVDGYDKLKRYGFAIHAAICGFSRRVVWYRIGRSNNDPKIIAGYFMEYVKEIQAVPRCIRCDDGTENVIMCDIQRGFRWDHEDDMAGYKSVLTGSSPSNQRIERWWRSSREGGIQFWIEVMKGLEFNGHLSTLNAVHIECARVCFLHLLESDMSQCVKEWNQHKIRHSTQAECPSGRPNWMFYQPELYGTVDYKTSVDPEDIGKMNQEFCEISHPYDPEFYDLCVRLIEEDHRRMPVNAAEAEELFIWLCSKME